MKSKRVQEAAAVAEEKPTESHDDANLPTKKRKRDDEVEDTGKKAKKDKKKKKGEKESRKEKKDKRKDLQDLPGEDNDEPEAANGEVSEAAPAESKAKKDKKDKKDKKEKKEKKSKKEKKDDDDEKTDEPPKKKSKKDKKKASSSSDETTTVAPQDAIPNGASNGIDLDVEGAAAANGDDAAAEGQESEKPDRHIVFVGNLPFTATAASISAHFASLSPIAVRCLTNKGDTKNTCKGIAFVEFAHVWTQRTCLDRFHHSMFDDGQSAPRKINVELTAGGGGTSENRAEKIREKNRKLDENRTKRIDKEKTTKAEAKGDSGTKEEQEEHMDEQVHPSRRAQMGSDAPPDDFQSGGGGGGGGRRGAWGGRSRGGGGRGRGGRGGRGRGRR
ncbi:RNA binding [Cordyceps militaris]|uniref:RNA binding n=1 Tax=Cordyceps militaris TaxID=73501 RepID=A0A2H4SHJ5_CORMI|nr:RNA binding [Cordyceps militaris]